MFCLHVVCAWCPPSAARVSKVHFLYGEPILVTAAEDNSVKVYFFTDWYFSATSMSGYVANVTDCLCDATLVWCVVWVDVDIWLSRWKCSSSSQQRGTSRNFLQSQILRWHYWCFHARQCWCYEVIIDNSLYYVTDMRWAAVRWCLLVQTEHFACSTLHSNHKIEKSVRNQFSKSLVSNGCGVVIDCVVRLSSIWNFVLNRLATTQPAPASDGGIRLVRDETARLGRCGHDSQKPL